MAQDTAISWCDHTFNVWWGCQHASADSPVGTSHADYGPQATSPECDNCYAESTDHRYGGKHWGPGSTRRFFGDAYWAKPIAWNAAAKRAGIRARVFCSSMADWAEIVDDPELRLRMEHERARLFRLIQSCRWLDWLLLTKRADNLVTMLPWHDPVTEPWPNVWVGVTCGVRSSLWRIDPLRRVRAAVRFVSCEPLLEHITSDDWDAALSPYAARIVDGNTKGERWNPIDWLIVGDESGARRRSAQPDWIRTAREAALRNRVTFHLKQWCGPDTPGISGMRKGPNGKIHLPMLDGRRWYGVPGSVGIAEDP